MSLQTNFIFKGFLVENGYLRVENLEGDKYNLNFSIVYYKNNLLDGGPLIKDRFNFIPDVSDEAHNFIKQCYEFAKSLPQFESALDV